MVKLDNMVLVWLLKSKEHFKNSLRMIKNEKDCAITNDMSQIYKLEKYDDKK